jgi:hypothetical protein
MSSIEQKTGTSNRAYDLVSVLYHALQGTETYDAVRRRRRAT